MWPLERVKFTARRTKKPQNNWRETLALHPGSLSCCCSFRLVPSCMSLVQVMVFSAAEVMILGLDPPGQSINSPHFSSNAEFTHLKSYSYTD